MWPSVINEIRYSYMFACFRMIPIWKTHTRSDNLSGAAMGKMKNLAALVMLGFLIKMTGSHGILSVKLLHFENPMSRLDNGSCCDKEMTSPSRCSPCQCYFSLCFSHATQHNCSIKRTLTETAVETEYHVFGTSLEVFPSRTTSNPLLIPVKHWTGSMSIKVDVFDRDSTNESFRLHGFDLVTSMWGVALLNATAYGKTAETQAHLLLGKEREKGVYPMLSLQTSLQCGKNYFLPTCSEYCEDANSTKGHYKCDYARGARLCLQDWYGVRCQTKCVARNDNFGHYKCHPKTGDKLCLPGWIHPLSNCTERRKIQPTRTYMPSESMLLATPMTSFVKHFGNSDVSEAQTQTQVTKHSWMQPTVSGTHGLVASSQTSGLRMTEHRSVSAKTIPASHLSRGFAFKSTSISETSKEMEIQTSTEGGRPLLVRTSAKPTAAPIAPSVSAFSIELLTTSSRASLSQTVLQCTTGSSALLTTMLPVKRTVDFGRWWLEDWLYFVSAFGCFIIMAAIFIAIWRKKRGGRIQTMKSAANRKPDQNFTRQRCSHEAQVQMFSRTRLNPGDTAFAATSLFRNDCSEILWREEEVSATQFSSQRLGSQRLPRTPTPHGDVASISVHSHDMSSHGAVYGGPGFYSCSASEHFIVAPPGTPFESQTSSGIRDEPFNAYAINGKASHNRNFLMVETAFSIHSSASLPRTPASINCSRIKIVSNMST